MSRPNQSHRLLLIIAVICLSLLVAANMLIIFSFSSEDREESGARSESVTRAVARLLNPAFDRLSAEEQAAAVADIHGIVRKTAHFLEYALLGFLTAGLLRLLLRGRQKDSRQNGFRRKEMSRLQAWLVPAAFCLVYAVSDEVHQLFTERGPRVTDVVIDLCGAVFGIACLHLGVWLVAHICRGHRDRKEAETA